MKGDQQKRDRRRGPRLPSHFVPISAASRLAAQRRVSRNTLSAAHRDPSVAGSSTGLSSRSRVRLPPPTRLAAQRRGQVRPLQPSGQAARLILVLFVTRRSSRRRPPGAACQATAQVTEQEPRLLTRLADDGMLLVAVKTIRAGPRTIWLRPTRSDHKPEGIEPLPRPKPMRKASLRCEHPDWRQPPPTKAIARNPTSATITLITGDAPRPRANPAGQSRRKRG